MTHYWGLHKIFQWVKQGKVSKGRVKNAGHMLVMQRLVYKDFITLVSLNYMFKIIHDKEFY